jgi:hypothetical protein
MYKKYVIILSLLLQIVLTNLSAKNLFQPFLETFTLNWRFSTQLQQSSEKFSSRDAEKIIQKRARQAILALKNRDMETLSKIVHPDKGVRFSPYSYIDSTRDVVLKAKQVKSLFADTTKYFWGTSDGSGEEIRMTFIRYFKLFIYDHDFASAKQNAYQTIVGRGNMINNISEVYPNAIWVEYHFPGFEKAYQGMDWRSLRLVFEKKEKTWYLVGIIHDQWTI